MPTVWPAAPLQACFKMSRSQMSHGRLGLSRCLRNTVHMVYISACMAGAGCMGSHRLKVSAVMTTTSSTICADIASHPAISWHSGPLKGRPTAAATLVDGTLIEVDVNEIEEGGGRSSGGKGGGDPA